MTIPKSIPLAKGLDLPFTVTTSKISLMGGNGSGKSYTTMKILEEILGAGGWVVVLDPVGIYYGLRLDKSGHKPSGLDVPIFGGLHGDVLITPTSGKLIADLICDRRLSVILDVSQFETDADLNRFATDFGNQFWNRMKAQRRAVTLVLEECQEFIPQNPSKGEERKLHVYNRICKIGRNYGIGVAMISARPQDINKKSLNLTQLMFAFQMTGVHERKAMEEWFTYAGVDSKLGSILPTLEVGEPWVMSPRLLKINKQVRILPKKTFDASATPDFEAGDSETIALKPLDISNLEEAMSAQIAEAEASDPAKLKKRIAQLERELQSRPTVQTKGESAPEKIEIRVPVFEDEQYFTLAGILKSYDEKADALRKELKAFSDKANADIVGMIASIIEPSRTLEEIRKAVNGHKASSTPHPLNFSKQSPAITYSQRGPAVYPGTGAYRPARKTDVAKAEYKTDSELTGPERRIVDALAWFESIGQMSPVKKAVAILAGYSPNGGGFTGPCGSLRNQKGYIDYDSGSRMFLTEAGRAVANYPKAALTQEAIQSQVMTILDGPQKRVLTPLIAAWPESVDKDALAKAAGYAPGTGGFTGPIGKLHTAGIVDYTGKGMAKAADFLFLQG